MKTTQEWIRTLDPYMTKLVGGKFYGDMSLGELEKLFGEIQQDAFESGRVNGLKGAVEIVSLRIVTPKNESFTAAIEEAKVFLGAEIERGGKPAYCVCQSTPNPLKSPSL